MILQALLPLAALAEEPSASCIPAPLVSAWSKGEASREDCLFVDLQAAGRLYASFPASGVSRGAALSRARAELGARVSDLSARVAVNAVRSSGEQGYLGIDGEAFVPEIRVAEARADLPDLGLAIAGGLVDDLYVMTIQPAWNRRDLLAPLPTDQGYLDRSDVGGWIGWTAADQSLSLSLSVTTGEGLYRRERNNGLDTTGLARWRPLKNAALSPEIVLMAREGSRGLGQAPDHRAGAAALLHHSYGVAGAEVLLGWGLQGDGTRRPVGGSLWAHTAEALPVTAALRADLARDDRGSESAGELLLLAAAGPTLPFGGSPLQSAPLVLLAGLESRRYGADARPVAGAEAYASVDTVFLMLSATVRGGMPFEPR